MSDFSGDVNLARKGDTSAFARLYSLVYEDMYHIALYSLRNSHDACDAVSETVLDAFSSIKKLRDEKAFRSWIMCILSAKIKQKQSEYYKYFSDSESETDELSENFSFENIELGQALEKLDPMSRLILSMSVLEGYTSEEIAEICEMKSATVRSRLSRIKQKLRLELC